MRAIARVGLLSLAIELAAAAAILLEAPAGCGGGSAGAASEAGEEAAVANETGADAPIPGLDGAQMDVQVAPFPDASPHACALADGSDPVLLCAQETALLYLTQNAYTAGAGVAPGYSTMPPFGAAGPHAASDDLALAAALGAFACSAAVYGDSEYAPMFAAVLADLAKLLPGELTSLTAGYDGETYFQLLTASQALAQSGDAKDAATLEAAAEAMVRSIAAGFVHAGAAGGGTVIGVQQSGGAVTYAPGESAMAAAALLDLAARKAGDGGAEASAWQVVGAETLSTLWSRARDPTTGLFYEALATSSDPSHDTPAGTTYAPDDLLTNVQATVLLALARAQAANGAGADAGANAGAGADAGPDGGTMPSYPAAIDALLASLSAANLFSGQTAMPAGAMPPPPPGAWMEGLIPSTAVTLTNLTTLSNARLWGASTRARAAAASTWELAGIAQALSFTTPLGVPWPPHSSLTSAVTDIQNDVIQTGYLTAVSRSWAYAPGFTAAGTDGGLAPGAQTYSTAAIAAVVEGLSQSWFTASPPAACAL